MDLERRSVALDLLATDLADPSAVAAFLAVHVLTPARLLYPLMKAPRAGETDDAVLFLDGDRVIGPRSDGGIDQDFEPSAAFIDGFLPGWLLFERLFPHIVGGTDSTDTALEAPGSIVFDRSERIANLLWGDLEALAGGLLGLAIPSPINRALDHRYEPTPNPDGLVSLRMARTIVALALEVPGEDATRLDYVRINTGLRQMDPAMAVTADRLLRLGVHQRLLLFRERVWGFAPGRKDPAWIHVDRGVLPGLVPETIEAAVMLDLVRTLALDPHAAPCGHCGRPLVLSRSQAARAARGEAVFHKGCHQEHRRVYVRDYQRTRAAGRTSATRRSGR